MQLLGRLFAEFLSLRCSDPLKAPSLRFGQFFKFSFGRPFVLNIISLCHAYFSSNSRARLEDKFFAAQMFLVRVVGALSVVLPQIWQNLALSATSVLP